MSMQCDFGVDVHYATVPRALRKDGFRARSRRKLPFISERNKVVRMQMTQYFFLKTV